MANEPPPPPDVSPARQEESRAHEKPGPPPAGPPFTGVSSQGRPAREGGSASERRALMQLSSAGFELASFSLLLGGAGYAVDHWLGNATPYFAIAGIVLGFCLGFYRLIVLASKMN